MPRAYSFRALLNAVDRRLSLLLVLLAACLLLPQTAAAQGRPDVEWMRGGHVQEAVDLKFTPDGQKLISSSRDGTVKVFRAADGILLRTFTRPDGHALESVNTIAVAPDNQTLAVADLVSNAIVVYLYNLSDGALQRTLSGLTPTNNEPPHLSFSPDGSELLVKKDIVRVSDGMIVRTIPPSISGASPTLGYSFSPDGSRLLVRADTHILEIDSITFSIIRDLNDNSVAGYSPNGLYAYTASGLGASIKRLSDLHDISLTGNTGAPNGSAAAFSADGQYFAASYATDGESSSTVKVWQVSNSSTTWSLAYQFQPESPAIGVDFLVFSPDSQNLATGKNFISLWNSANGSLVRPISMLGTGGVQSLAFSSDSQTLATANTDVSGVANPNGVIQLWNVADGSRRNINFSQSVGLNVNRIAFADNNQKLITTEGDSRTVKVWNAADGSLIRSTPFTGSSCVDFTLVVSTDQQTYAVGSCQPVIYRVSDGSEVRTISSSNDAPIAFSPDGQVIATNHSFNNNSGVVEVNLWNVANGTFLRTLANTGDRVSSGVGKAAFSPDSQTIAVIYEIGLNGSGTGCISLFRVSDGSFLRTLGPFNNWGDSIAFARDGQSVISTGWDGTVRIWRVSDGALLRTYDHETGVLSGRPLSQVAYSPDGSHFAYGRGDATVVMAHNPITPSYTLSVIDLAVTEGNAGTSNALVHVYLSGASSQSVTVNYATSDGTATSNDYQGVSGTLTFSPGQITKTFTVPIKGDTIDEADETFNVTLSAPTNATLDDGQAVVTIIDNDPSPSVSIANKTFPESAGSSTSFSVTLSSASARMVTLSYSTSDGTAEEGKDYTATSGSLTFNPGETAKTIPVTITSDTLDEADETFTVTLRNAVNATIPTDEATGTITDDDAAPMLSILDKTVTEGNAGTANAAFTVKLSAASGLEVKVNYLTSNGTALAASDYLTTQGQLIFSPGQLTQTINVPVKGDAQDEPNETFNLSLVTPVNATISDAQAIGTITDNDLPPGIKINSINAAEGNSGTTTATFTVSLTAASGQTVTVKYATTNGTAIAPSDYTAVALTTLTFTPGQTSKTIGVPVKGDLLDEPNETFKVLLSNPTNATLAVSQGTGTITDNDLPPKLTITDATVTEGNSGATNAVFTVKLSAASGQTVTVRYATANGTAIAPTDYTTVSGTLSFAPGQTSKTLAVPVKGDIAIEPNETFKVNLSAQTNATIGDGAGLGTILNND